MGSNFQHPFKLLDGLGARLKDAREEIGLSQKDLAAAGGVTRFTQAGYENEATDPNIGYLKLIQKTGIDLQYILYGRRQDLLKSKSGTAGAPESLRELMHIRTDIGDRMRTARTTLGLKQAEIAEIGSISRATQVSYETGVTEPTTAFLRAIQASGMDIPFVLFGHSSTELDSYVRGDVQIDWSRLQRAHEDVEFFCQRVAPACPNRYRWMMVATLYSSHLKLDNSQPPKDTMTFLSNAIENHLG